MANLKFSGFTANAAVDQTDSFLVGFDTDNGGANPTNNKWTFAQIAAGLNPTNALQNIYNVDGTIPDDRQVALDAGKDLLFSTDSATLSTIAFGPSTNSQHQVQITTSSGNTGSVRVPINGNYSILSYGTTLAANYLRFYGSSYITGTPDATSSNLGLITISNVTGASYSIDARLGVVGTTNDNTKYAFRVQNLGADDLFSLKNDGTFALGKGAVSSSDDNVVIGGDATDTASSNSFNVIIGKDASITGTGNQGCIILGDSSLGTATGAVAVGSQAKAQAVNAIAIGQRAQPTGANSITLDSSGSGLTTPSTANAFGVYMTSNATPDLEVVGGGESTLRTSLLIPGTESDITINPNQQDCFSIDSIDGAQNDFFTIKRAGATKVQIGLIGSFYGGISLFDNTQATQLQLRSLSTGNFIKPNIHLGDSTEAAEKLEVTGNTKVTGQSYYTIPTALTNATINFNTGNIQEISIPSETATDFTPTNAKSGATYIIKITQAGTSGTMNWESSATVNWPGGTAPTLTSTSAGVDIITLVCTVGGATGGTFYGTSALNFS